MCNCTIQTLITVINNKIFGNTTEQENIIYDNLVKDFVNKLNPKETELLHSAVKECYNKRVQEIITESAQDIKKCKTSQELTNLIQGNSSQAVSVPLYMLFPTRKQPSSSLQNTSKSNFMQHPNHYNR